MSLIKNFTKINKSHKMSLSTSTPIRRYRKLSDYSTEKTSSVFNKFDRFKKTVPYSVRRKETKSKERIKNREELRKKLRKKDTKPIIVPEISWLKYIINSNKGKNALMPTKDQVNYLNRYNIYELSGSKWYDYLSKNSEKNVLFSCHKHPKSLFHDEMQRAQRIYFYMKEEGKRTLKTMDGHGRFIFCFFHILKIYGENIDEWTIDVYDIIKSCHNWHKLFFPTNVNKHFGNIFDERLKSDQVLYLNFCGIGSKNYSYVQSNLKVILNTHTVFLTCSNRRWKNATSKRTQCTIFQDYFEGLDKVIISKRQLMFSYKINKVT